MLIDFGNPKRERGMDDRPTIHNPFTLPFNDGFPSSVPFSEWLQERVDSDIARRSRPAEAGTTNGLFKWVASAGCDIRNNERFNVALGKCNPLKKTYCSTLLNTIAFTSGICSPGLSTA